MRHIGIFAQPIGRLCLIPLCVKHPSGRFQPFGLWFLRHFCTQFVTFLVVGFFLVVHKEVDTGSKEVHRRGLEELVTAATAFLLALLQRFQQGLGRLRGSSKVIDILLLNGVHPSGVFHIHKVDYREFAPFG